MAVHKRKASKRKVSKRKYQNANAGSNSQGGNAQGGSSNISGVIVGGSNIEQNNPSQGSTVKKSGGSGGSGGTRGSGDTRGSRGVGSGVRNVNPPSFIDRLKNKGNQFLDFIGFEDGGTSAFSKPMDEYGHGVQRGGKKSKRR